MCKLFSYIVFYSTNSSIITALIVAVDRFVCIVFHPYERYEQTKKKGFIQVISAWLFVSVELAFIVVVNSANFANSSCTLLGNSLSSICSYVHQIINSAIFIILFILSGSILRKLQMSTKNKNLRKSSPGHSNSAIYRIVAVILTNFAAWTVVSILTLLSLSKYHLPPSVEATLGLVFFPLNAIVNPEV